MKNNDWKAKLGVVYSTNPDFTRTEADDIVLDSVVPSKQTLRIEIDKKGRNLQKPANNISIFLCHSHFPTGFLGAN